MIVTNGKIVTVKDQVNGLEDLNEFMNNLFMTWNDAKGLDLDVDEYYVNGDAGNPHHYTVPDGMPITYINDAGAEIRAINESVFVKPGTVILDDHRRDFTQDEMDEFVDQWPVLMMQIEDMKEEKKAVNKEMNKAIKDKEKELKKITTYHKDGYAVDAIECRVECDNESGVVKYYATSDGALIKTSDMTDADGQMFITV